MNAMVDQNTAVKAQVAVGPRVVIIGAGISGILMGIRMRQRGWTDFQILEKAETLGGTWRDNVYPGVACDVAAHLYVYSFDPNPSWKTRFANGKDIWAYYERMARKYRVSSHIKYNKEVVRSQWTGEEWLVTTRDGGVFRCDVLVGANGRLHHPKMPDISGRDRFAGKAFHTARWDQSVDLRGKRVGLIGTGSTATQIVSSIADQVSKLVVFQRTAQWVLPIDNEPNSLWQRIIFTLFPNRLKEHFLRLQTETEIRGKAATGDRAARAARDQRCIDALNSVKDPVLRAKLTPDYEVGCKRLVMSGTFYEAIQNPTVDVVVDPIDHIEEDGVSTSDGKLHEIDVLIYATGFQTHVYTRPMEFVGEGGINLNEVWAEHPVTYRSITVPKMPNLFLISGPYAPGGSASVVGVVERQVEYILKLMERVVANQTAIAPREDVAWQWLNDVRKIAKESVWGTGGCQSWYLDETGTPTLDTSTLSELEAALSVPEFEHFVERPRQASDLRSR